MKPRGTYEAPSVSRRGALGVLAGVTLACTAGLAPPVPGPVWYAARIDGTTRVESGADVVLPAASVIKLLIALTLIEQARAGRFGVATRVPLTAIDRVGGSDRFGAAAPGSYPGGALLDAMLSLSDNTASNALLAAVGMRRCNDVAASHGLRSTRVRRRFYDWAAERRGLENETTPREAAAMLLLLARDAAQDGPASGVARRAMSALLAQTDRETIPFALPNRGAIANKTGELPGVRNDVAIVGYGHAGSYVVAVFDRFGSAERASAIEAIRGVVRMVDRQLRPA